jgi:hypothetical protein
MFLLKLLAFVFLIPGFGLVFAAKRLVQKYQLDEKVKLGEAGDMSEEEIKNYKYNKALVNLKMLGMAIAMPGIVLVFIAFR